MGSLCAFIFFWQALVVNGRLLTKPNMLQGCVLQDRVGLHPVLQHGGTCLADRVYL